MIKVRLLHHGAKAPARANATDAGLDLYSDEPFFIEPYGRRLASTGISIEIPDGYVAYIKPRSGLALKSGIDVMAGVIDASYRGEIMVLLANLSVQEFRAYQGDRIAQLVIQKIELWTPVVVDELDETVRGENGFGSSGK